MFTRTFMQTNLLKKIDFFFFFFSFFLKLWEIKEVEWCQHWEKQVVSKGPGDNSSHVRGVQRESGSMSDRSDRFDRFAHPRT